MNAPRRGDAQRVERVSRALVERAQQGDRDAYESLARESARRLYLTAYRIVRDDDLAEDATQRTLIAIWQDLPSLRDPDRFDAWTYRMVVRFCREESRRLRRIGVRVVDISDVKLAAPDDAAQLSRRDLLDGAFRSLSHDHRVVVVLHHYVGLSLAEIADILDVPYGTVGSRLHHALRAMRASIEAADRMTVAGGHPA